MNNLWIKKLKNLILAKRNWSDNNSDKKNFHLDLIKQGNYIIENLIQYLLSTYTRANSNNIDINSLTHFNKNISDIKLMELSGYYNRVISQENMKINKKFSYIIKKKSNDDKYVSIIVPYLPEEIEGKKKFTLVLDLDETLISFRIDEHHRGMVKMRPGLYKFLKNVGSKYELIIFTAGTQEYADPILDVIEKNEKFLQLLDLDNYSMDGSANQSGNKSVINNSCLILNDLEEIKSGEIFKYSIRNKYKKEKSLQKIKDI